ncbi:Hypothetical predicted protein [Marmota monax]|uniref:RING-type domain-containing protein n=1 Tax=Marmota monax TaxID=9995 RepID=A0A5E4A6E5_MARMO|nr:hypothetical protein GHT09_015814 [Marmota monax]VTJ52282.1 Hypothetical predicted protein [Marmota monax]
MAGPGEPELCSVAWVSTYQTLGLICDFVFQLCAVCLEDFKPRDELGICPCKHAFHRKCLIKWLEVRKVCPLCNMPVLQLAQLHNKQDHGPPQGPLPGAENIV